MQRFEALVDADFAAADVGRGWLSELQKLCGLGVHGLRRAARVMKNRWAGYGPAAPLKHACLPGTVGRAQGFKFCDHGLEHHGGCFPTWQIIT